MAATGITMFLLSTSCRLISAAPLTPLENELQAANDNKTLLNSEFAPPWATTSNIRSTASLLWTCVLTLAICVFTVIHINVPPPNETQYSHILRKTKWAFFAILAPELVLTMALQQWSSNNGIVHVLSSANSTPCPRNGMTGTLTRTSRKSLAQHTASMQYWAALCWMSLIFMMISRC